MNLRVQKVRQQFALLGIDSIFVSNFYNILYLTGFKTLTTNEREAFVLVTNQRIYLFTDSRYEVEQMHISTEEIIIKLLEPGKGLFQHLQEIIVEEKIQLLGVEGDDLRTHEYLIFKKLFPSIQIISTERYIVKIREVKSQDEIEKIKRSCKFSDDCLRNIIPIIRIGMTEKEIAFKLEYWLKEHFADIAFDPIVAVNKNSSVPHYNTKMGNGIVENSSVILIDYGAKYQDYLSDITRMIFLKPNDEMIQVYHQLLEVQKQTIAYISRSKSPLEIDEFCRDGLKKKTLPNFSHSVGHGVGLEIHEYPKISQTSQDTIQEHQVFTVEPGAYFENKWGIRIEDTVVIQNGGSVVLTQFSKDQLIIQ